MSQSILEKNQEAADSKQPRKKSGGTIFIILFLTVFALGFGALGAGMVHSAYMKEKTYPTAEGRVVSYRDYHSKSTHYFIPVVEYQVGNQVFTTETNTQFNYQPLKKGENVTIYYNPQKPDEFYIKEFDLKINYKIGGVFLFISIGILFFFVLFTVLEKIKIDSKKKGQIQTKLILSAIFLFMFTIFSCVAGLWETVCIFTGMGLFALFIWNTSNKRKK